MAVYTTGTVTVTNDSAIVTGVGTSFIAAGIARGNLFMIRSQGVAYFVAAVDSATRLRLTSPYAGTSGSGKAYTIALSFTERLELPLMVPGDVDTATIYSRAMAIIDDAFGGSYKLPARMASTVALPANSRASGLTLVANAVGAITTTYTDGVTPVLGDRFLLKNETDASKNGIYTWTDLGDTSAPWELTRTTDFDTTGEVNDGDHVPVQEGTTLADTSWRLTTNGPITLDVTSLTFTQLAAGPTGPTGPQGDAAGADYKWSSNTAMTDPGAGYLKFNHSTVSSATAIAIDNLTQGAADVSAWLSAFDDSTNTNKGTIFVIKENAPSVIAIFTVTGLATTSGGFVEAQVTYIAGAGSFTNDGKVRLLFARTGDKGDTGATGTTGSTGAQGDAGGVKFTFSTSTTMADPGAGALRFNNATPSSVTEIALDDLSANAADISEWILSFDDTTSTTKGTLHIVKENDASVLAVYRVTNITNVSGGWKQLAVVYVSGAGSFMNGLAIRLAYEAKGDKGDTGATGNTGTTGNTGLTGATGAEGVSAGVRWNFDTTITMADPGAGDIRLNNATLASVTAAALSANSGASGNPDVSDYVVTWDDSTSAVKGHLIISKVGAPQNVAIYSVSGSVVDNTAWLQVTLTHVASSGSFSAADPLSVQFVRTGDKGTDGVGAGDVVGPASSTNNNFSQFDGTTGKLIKDGGFSSGSFDASGAAAAVNSSLTAHLNDAVDAHDASAVEYSTITGENITAQNVQGALEQLDDAITAHLVDAVDAHDASAISYVVTGGIAATTVQEALTELDNEKRTWNPRSSSEASNATPTINADSVDQHSITALATAPTFGAPTGTPGNSQKIIYRIKDNGTARALAWNSIYRALGVALPTTTVVNKTMYLGFIYNSTDAKWDLVAKSEEA